MSDPTTARLADPRPGDRFTELCDYWVEVLYREGDLVLYRNATAGGNWGLNLATTAEFVGRFSCGTGGPWVTYRDARGPVMSEAEARGWIAAIEARRAAEAVAASMMGASL